MGTNPIRIHEKDKARLRKLSQDLALAKGRPVTKQEALACVVSFAIERREDFLKDATWKPLSTEQIKKWEETVGRLKGWKAIPVSDVDDVAYGR